MVNAFGCSPNTRRFNSCSALHHNNVFKSLFVLNFMTAQTKPEHLSRTIGFDFRDFSTQNKDAGYDERTEVSDVRRAVSVVGRTMSWLSSHGETVYKNDCTKVGDGESGARANVEILHFNGVTAVSTFNTGSDAVNYGSRYRVNLVYTSGDDQRADEIVRGLKDISDKFRDCGSSD